MGRLPSGQVPQHALQRILPRHRDIMYRLIGGQSAADIARDIDMSQSRLSIIINSPLFKRELASLATQVEERIIEKRASVSQKLELLKPKALDAYEKILDGEKISLSLKRQAAADVMRLNEQDRKNRDVEDGMNAFARLITDAFGAAQRAHERGDVSGDGNGNGDGNGDGDTFIEAEVESFVCDADDSGTPEEDHAGGESVGAKDPAYPPEDLPPAEEVHPEDKYLLEVPPDLDPPKPTTIMDVAESEDADSFVDVDVCEDESLDAMVKRLVEEVKADDARAQL